MFNDRFKLPLAAAGLLFTIVWFAMLAGRPLFDPDEGRYAEIPREMLARGEWIIPHLDGFVYLEKPPLQYWATALAFAALGQSEWSARLCTGFAGFSSLLLVFATGSRLWGLEAGLKALLLTAGSILFVLLGHQLTLDMSLNACLLASLSCFIFAQTAMHEGTAAATRSRRAAWWMAGCWASMALAVLTKGLIGVLIPGFTLSAYVLWQRDAALLSRLNFRFGLPVFAAIAAPWFVLAARADGEFLRFFFIREHFQRFLTPIEQRTEPWWFFVPVLIIGVLPWISRAVAVMVRDWRAAEPRGVFNPLRLLWIWSAFILVFFSVSDSKLIPYILPAIPSLALAAAAPSRGNDAKHLWLGAAASAVFAAGVLVYAAAIWGSPGGRAIALELRPALLWTAAALIGAAVVCGVLTVRRLHLAALAALCCGWFASGAAITVGASAAQRFFSAKDLAARIATPAPPGTALYSVQTYEQSLEFYLGRELTLVDYRDEFALGIREDPGRAVGDLEEFSRIWRAQGDAYAIMPLRTQRLLAERGLPMREIERFPTRIVLVSRR